MPKAFPDGQSSICKRGLWETILTHHYQNTTTRLQPLTAAASSSSYEASGIPEMKPVKMTRQGGPNARSDKNAERTCSRWRFLVEVPPENQLAEKAAVERDRVSPDNSVHTVHLLQSQKTNVADV